MPNYLLKAGPIPNGCIKNAEMTLELTKRRGNTKRNIRPNPKKGIGAALFSSSMKGADVGGGGALGTSKALLELNQTINVMKELNQNKAGQFIKELSKKHKVNTKEFLSIGRGHPEYFCFTENQVNNYSFIEEKYKNFKNLKPMRDTISRIEKKCSPSAIVKKLKRMGKYDSTRFNKLLTKDMKIKARGEKRRFRKKVMGYKFISDYIYHETNGFSDPLKHNENKYQYFIHVVRRTHGLDTFKYVFGKGKQYLNILDKTSLSLVNQNDTVPFGNFGFGILVWMDSKSLWATGPGNLTSDKVDLKGLNKAYPIIPPKTLFDIRKKSKIRRNNEIVSLKGTDILGYFLFKDRKTGKVMIELYEPKRLKVLERACVKNNLPVVYLKYGK